MSQSAVNPLLQQNMQVSYGSGAPQTDATGTVELSNPEAAVDPRVLPGLPVSHRLLAQAPANSDAPPLPDVQGSLARSTYAAQASANYQAMFSNDMPITSLAMAFSVLTDVAADTMLQYGKLKNIFNRDQVMALIASAKDQIDEVQGERNSAAWKLAGAAIAVVLVIGVGFAAGWATAKGDDMAVAVGGALGGVGMPLSQLVNATTTYLDTDATFGGQHQADEAKIRKAIQDIFVQMYKSQEDSFNNEYENARKSVQNIMEMKRSVDDNDNQVKLTMSQNT